MRWDSKTDGVVRFGVCAGGLTVERVFGIMA